MPSRREKIRELLAISICEDVSKCMDKFDIKHDLGADSLSLLSFITELNEEFNINTLEIDDKEFLSHIATVGDLLDKAEEYVEKKID